MIRSIAAVAAGYVTTLVGVSTFFAIVMVLAFGGMPADAATFHPPSWLLWLEIAFSPVLAAAGGYVCAWIAREREMRHACALAAVMVVMGAISVVGDAGLKPMSSTIAVVVLGIAGALGGAWLRVAQGRRP